MPQLLTVTELGNPVLREVAKQVEDVHDPEIQSLIDDLIHTCEHVDGVGIAAPQVGKSLRLFIVASKPNARYPDAPQMEPTAMINPFIVDTFGRTEKGWEGCLSIPGIRGLVPRNHEVFVEYIGRNGKLNRIWYEGFIARVIQHELDHLDGIVFLDRADPKDLATNQEFERIMREERSTN